LNIAATVDTHRIRRIGVCDIVLLLFEWTESSIIRRSENSRHVWQLFGEDSCLSKTGQLRSATPLACSDVKWETDQVSVNTNSIDVQMIHPEADRIHPTDIDAERAPFDAPVRIRDVRLQGLEASLNYPLLTQVHAVVICAAPVGVNYWVVRSSQNVGHVATVLPAGTLARGLPLRKISDFRTSGCATSP
jgi:hypothetical protein